MERRRYVGLLVAILLLLTGCTGLLEREYVVSTVHSDIPQAAEESDALRVESYQELVNALLYLVNQGEENGVIRLYNYDVDTAKTDLTAACLELSEEVPIGAYGVSYLQYDLTTIVSYLEADITITYRRTAQQMSSIQTAVGPSAIRAHFAQALENFQQEIVLQLNYYDGDEAELRELLQRAYYETPSAALGMPQVEIDFYPRTGTQRIAEVTLTYAIAAPLQYTIQSKCVEVANQLLEDSWDLSNEALLLELCHLVVAQGGVQSEGTTAYDALVRGGATSEGLSLALTLLCEERGVSCVVVQGTQNGVEHFWNVIITPWGYRHVDLTTFDQSLWEDGTVSENESLFFSDRTAVEAGYNWNLNWVPLCGDQPEEQELLAVY